MKKILNTVVLLTASIFALTSCGPKEEDTLTLTAPTLSSDTASVEITEMNDNTALTFNWTAASSSLTVNYALQITSAGDTEFASGTSFDCATALTKSFTSNEIKALMGELGIEAESFSLIARVRATSADVEAVNSASLTIAVEINLPVYIPETLYILGNATDFGWNRNKAEQALTKGENGLFTWSGNLYATTSDGFKFTVLNDGEFVPCYVRDAQAANYWTLRLNTNLDYSEPDEKFQVEQDGVYSVSLDVVALTISVERTGDIPENPDEVVIENLYPIGDAMPWSWSQDNAKPMQKIAKNSFRWVGYLLGGKDFKFLCQNDGNWSPSFNRDASATDYWTILYCANGSPDDKFQVEADGYYIIAINADTKAPTISVSAYSAENIYPIGGAFSWGWSQDNAEKMTAVEGQTGVYEWTGPMNAGDNTFKFLCQNDGNWAPGYNRDATATEYWTSVYRANGDMADKQFAVSEAGNYKLTLDVMNNTLTAAKQ